MTSLQMQTAFELEAAFIDDTIKPMSSDIFYFINRAVEKFVKTRYDGNNFLKTSFEGDQKRVEDLRTLINKTTINTTTGTFYPNSYVAAFPSDYYILISDEVSIQFINSLGISTTVRNSVQEITSERLSDELDNPFSEYHLHYETAKPLRLLSSAGIELIGDGYYTIPTYYLRYISQPATVSLTVPCNLPPQTHPEIIKLAVGMYLENIKDHRYSTYQNEINTVE